MITHSGRDYLMRVMVGATPAGPLTLHLFTNVHSPRTTDQRGDYTECSGAGYTAKVLSTTGWRMQDGQLIYPDQTWEFEGPCGQVYGRYVTNGRGVLVAAEKFDRSYDVRFKGDRLTVPVMISWMGA